MARSPEYVQIGLHELMLLLNYKWSAVNSLSLGELGDLPYEQFVANVDAKCDLQIQPKQLEDLIYNLKQGVLNGIPPARLRYTMTNYNKVLKKLRAQNPHLFKTLESGEVVMKELEESVYAED